MSRFAQIFFEFEMMVSAVFQNNSVTLKEAFQIYLGKAVSMISMLLQKQDALSFAAGSVDNRDEMVILYAVKGADNEICKEFNSILKARGIHAPSVDEVLAAQKQQSDLELSQKIVPSPKTVQ